jgi:hypothetical protein
MFSQENSTDAPAPTSSATALVVVGVLATTVAVVLGRGRHVLPHDRGRGRRALPLCVAAHRSLHQTSSATFSRSSSR